MITKNTLFISDTHFYHRNINTFEPGRLKEAIKQNFNTQEEFLINNWNSVCKDNQTIIHLGDFYINKSTEIDKLNILKGNKYLLKGNHDNAGKIKYENIGFNVIERMILDIDVNKNKELIQLLKEYAKLKYSRLLIFSFNGIRFLASHFPITDNDSEDNKKFHPQMKLLKNIFIAAKCDYNIHGHTHSHIMDDKRCINVSVENIDFKPISLEEIINKYIRN